MLGHAVVAETRRRGWPALGLGRAQADVTDSARLLDWADRFRPQVIVNCAAFTQVDLCETERERAMAINGAGVGHVARAAQSVGAALVHVSTDYVFDGQASTPYATTAATAPRSVYGESKLLGEHEALRSERAAVVRTSWLFGPNGPNFAHTILGLIARGVRPLRVVDDQRGAPTYTPFLARAIADLAQARATGVFHFRNRPAVTWFDFASEIARQSDDNAEVVPVTTAEFPRPAPRPAYSVLDVERFEATVGRKVEPWVWGLAAYLQKIRRETSKEESS